MYQIRRVLRLARVMGDLSQSEMAEKIGISQSMYSSVESGHFIPSRKMLRKVAESLGMSVESVILVNMVTPIELSDNHREMFNQIREVLVGKLISRLGKEE